SKANPKTATALLNHVATTSTLTHPQYRQHWKAPGLTKRSVRSSTRWPPLALGAQLTASISASTAAAATMATPKGQQQGTMGHCRTRPPQTTTRLLNGPTFSATCYAPCQAGTTRK